jgi:hypothetical protein
MWTLICFNFLKYTHKHTHARVYHKW